MSGLIKKGEEKNILMFYLRGGAFHVFLLTIMDGIFAFKSTTRDINLGGLVVARTEGATGWEQQG